MALYHIGNTSSFPICQKLLRSTSQLWKEQKSLTPLWIAISLAIPEISYINSIQKENKINCQYTCVDLLCAMCIYLVGIKSSFPFQRSTEVKKQDMARPTFLKMGKEAAPMLHYFCFFKS